MSDTNGTQQRRHLAIVRAESGADFIDRVATLRRAIHASGLLELTADSYRHLLPVYRTVEHSSDDVFDAFTTGTGWGYLHAECCELAAALLDAVGAGPRDLPHSAFLTDEDQAEHDRRDLEYAIKFGLLPPDDD